MGVLIAGTHAMASAPDFDDFAMQMYEDQESRKRTMLQEAELFKERWWIVMHAKVAVRPGPNKDGDPVVVLPRGSVVSAQTVVKVGKERWLRIHDDELPFLKKRQSLPTAAEAYMLLEAADLGELVMAAPKEFNWESLKEMHPKHRGEAARQEMLAKLGGPTIEEATDADIEALLGQYSGGEGEGGSGEGEGGSGAPPRAPSRAPSAASGAAPPRAEAEREVGVMREFVDGLVDVDPAPKPAAVAAAAGAAKPAAAKPAAAQPASVKAAAAQLSAAQPRLN